MLNRILQMLKRVFHRHQTETVQLDDQGYRLLRKDVVTTEVLWKDVQEVFAYKKDLYTTDLICVGFRLADDRVAELHEEGDYWETLLDVLPKAFPGISPTWFIDIMVPAFEPSPTCLWGEPKIANPQPPAA